MKTYLFVDIETAPCVPSIEQLDPVMRNFWNEKYTKYKEDGQDENEYFMQQAGLIPEFGKIVCLSVGYENKQRKFVTSSYTSTDEKELLESFLKMYRPTKRVLVGHNLKYFDLPFINRRCLVHGLKIPKEMEILDKAPRKIPHLDTMDMYKNGGSRCSLGVISYLLTGENPKYDISGADVGKIYRKSIEKENDKENFPNYVASKMNGIAEYCERDVEATRKIFKIMKNQAKKADPYFVEPQQQLLTDVPKSENTPYSDTANAVRQDMIKQKQRENINAF